MTGPGIEAAARPQLVITVNGPGEIAAWLYPLSVAVRRARPDIRICVCLLPCVFSSGAERGVLDGMETVDAVADVGQSFGLILKDRLPDGFRRDVPTLLFHLGGETALTVLIARRLGCRMFGYAEAPPGWQGRFERLFFSGLNKLPPAIPPGDIVGDMMVDAADLRRAAARRDADGTTTIGLFPGSRDYMVGPLLPFMAAAADELARRRPALRFVIAKSDFLDWDFLANLPRSDPGAEWAVSEVTLHREDGRAWLMTGAGTRIDVLTNAQVLAGADLAVSLPGTNTGEMGAAGLPSVVIVPLHMANRNAHQTPLPGLPGHVGRIPLIGPPLQRFFAHQALKRTPLLSLPNRRAGRMIVPELVGDLTPGDIADTLETLLDGDRAALSAELRAAMGAGGAAARLADEIDGYFRALVPAAAPSNA
ncbi:MAG: hypothetical protein ACE368_11075 [Paracoccaceae bacterium]